MSIFIGRGLRGTAPAGGSARGGVAHVGHLAGTGSACLVIDVPGIVFSKYPLYRQRYK